jgi:hypothetical protein
MWEDLGGRAVYFRQHQHRGQLRLHVEKRSWCGSSQMGC